MNVVFDLDGTLANAEHRVHHIRKEPRDWDAYHAACPFDTPKWPLIELATNLIRRGNTLEIWTGRREVVRSQTEQWLSQYGLGYFHGGKILMRPTGDFREDTVLKAEWLEQAIKDGFKPDLIIEDRARMIQMWRSKGIMALQCEDGNY